MEKIKLHRERLAVSFAGQQADREKRTIPLTWYSGETVLRHGWDGNYNLTFSMDPAHVQLGRLNTSGQLLDSHSDYRLRDILGVVERAWIEGGKGKAIVRFSERDEVTPIWNDVQAGIIRNASMGVAIYKLKDVTAKDEATKSYLAISWEPSEVSLVAVPADSGAGTFKGAAEEFCECELVPATAGEGESMSDTVVNTGSAGVNPDAQSIRNLVQLMKLEPTFGDKLIAQSVTLDAARVQVIDEVARRAGPEIRTAHGEVTRDHREGLVERLSEALACRYNAKPPSDAAREFMGAPISEFARECLRTAGMRVPRQPAEIIRLGMHGTSDFPNLLTGTGQRLLLDAYNAASPAIKQVARRSTVTDFRVKAVLRLGEAPTLVKVPETGEVTHGTRAEMKESYRAFTYGRIFSISREALVNDDLSAFADFARAFGVAAAQLEGTLLVDLLASNPVMSDGKQLFDATYHANLVNPGTAISVDNLSIARTMTRLQTGLDGTTVLDIPPRYLVVPATKETLAEAYLTSIQAATAADVNPFPGKLTLVVDGHLDGKSTTAWYLFGDPNLTPVLEYSYLSGAEGVQVDSRAGWEQLGQEFRAILDYGVGVLDYRGALLNLGA
jgi:hypothetical protein